MRSLKSKLAKLTDSIVRMSMETETHAPLSSIFSGCGYFMAKNLEELCRLSGANNRSISKVFGPAVRDHVGPELYNRLAKGWTGSKGNLLVAAYFKLTRAARVAAGGLPATGDPGVCKACTKPPVAGNYGFCHECRATKKQKK